MYAAITPVIRLPGTLPDTFDYSIPDTLASFVQRGSIVVIPWRSRTITGVVISTYETPNFSADKVKKIAGLVIYKPLPEWFIATTIWAAKDCAVNLGTFLKNFIPAVPKRAIITDPEASSLNNINTDSRIAAPQIAGRLIGGFNDHIALISEVVQKNCSLGKSVLVLTPHRRELVPLAKTAEHTIQYPVSILDQEISAGARFKQFCSALSIESPTVFIGTRSAALHPISNLGEIILLESESRDYRNFDGSPHYDARTLSRERCFRSGVSLTLSSFAPRAEDAGYFVDDQIKPEPPTIVDIATKKHSFIAGVLSEYAKDAMLIALQAGRSVLLLHNRKGANVGLFCNGCREVIRCQKCHGLLSPTSRSGSGIFICRRCRSTAPTPKQCGACGNMVLKPFGSGTEGIAQSLSEMFPGAEVRIVDSDQDKESESILTKDADIVVGTSLALHDALYLPHVLSRLGVIIATTIDNILSEPDLRANERAWQDLRNMQKVATESNAELIIQTINPEDQVFKRLSEGLAAATREREYRKQLNYPPFGRLVTLSPRSGNFTNEILQKCKDVGVKENVQLIGPIKNSKGVTMLIMKKVTLDPIAKFLRTLPEDIRIDTDPDVSS